MFGTSPGNSDPSNWKAGPDDHMFIQTGWPGWTASRKGRQTDSALGGRFCLKAYVETSVHLLEGIDEMVKEGYFGNRTEAVNEAISILLKQYKISKLHVKDAKQRDQPAGN